MDAKMAAQVEMALKRIFCLPVTKSTFRQFQHAIVTLTNGNNEESKALIEALVTGKAEYADPNVNQTIKNLSQQYSLNIIIAKEIIERGEYLALLSSDILTLHQDIVILSNIIRRLDGEEFQFVSDIDGSFHVIQHFISRLEEILKIENKKQAHDQVRQKFANLHEQLGKWLQKVSNSA